MIAMRITLDCILLGQALMILFINSSPREFKFWLVASGMFVVE